MATALGEAGHSREVNVVSAARSRPQLAEEYGPTLVAFGPAELAELYGERALLRADGVRALASLWKRSVTGDLGAVQRLLNRWSGLAAVIPLPTDAQELIPCVASSRDATLRLSSYDATLLGMYLSKTWADVLSRFRETRDAFMKLLRISGDMVIAVRLQQWAQHAPHLFESRRVEPSKSPMMAVEYRLTDAGERALREGLRNPVEAPPMQTGGCVAYAHDTKWVRAASGLVRWNPRRV